MQPRARLESSLRLRAVPALVLAAGLTTLAGCSSAADTAEAQHEESTSSALSTDPIVVMDDGRVRGVAIPGAFAFRGLPYAAPPTGNLRWRAPRAPAAWSGVRDATAFAPSCPQVGHTFTKGPSDEDCLYLNVYTPQLDHHGKRARPVLVFIHGGGFTTGAGRDYDPAKLAAEGTVVVTINYRLGALGFLSHPALASKPGGSSGNYGLMDQQASLRWVQDNIGRFGGDPHNVTIAGESAGGLAVLMHMISRDSHGLFQRAIVQSGSFALAQQSLASAEAAGEAAASQAGCSEHAATCLRNLAVDDVNKLSSTVIPGTVDGKVITESIGTALAGGRFARVPILNGSNHDEELLFVAGLEIAVSGGTNVLVGEVTAENYQPQIARVLGVTHARASAIAAEYPLDAYPAPVFAFSALVGDANFACTALQQDKWTSRATPTFAYELNDDAAPPRYLPFPAATHTSELAYIFDLPDTPFQTPLSADQERLAATMRAAWASFAASGDPSTCALPWPWFDDARVMSLVPPQPRVEADFAARHHCSFWTAR